MSQPQSSSNNEELVRWDEQKEKTHPGDFSYVTAEQMGTVEGRENQRDLISRARPQDPEAVLNEQRILAEGLDVAGAIVEERERRRPVDIDFSEENAEQIEPILRRERNNAES